MPAETLNQLGFVKIPEAMQRHMGLRPGDKIDVRVLSDGRVMMVKAGVVWATEAVAERSAQRAPLQRLVVGRDDFDPHRVPRWDVPVRDDKDWFDVNDPRNEEP